MPYAIHIYAFLLFSETMSHISIFNNSNLYVLQSHLSLSVRAARGLCPLDTHRTVRIHTLDFRIG